MSAPRTAPLPKSKAAIHLRKASNFLRAAQSALHDRNFDAAGLAGLHAVISACDGLTVSKLGLRSTAQNHSDVLRLLVNTGMPEATMTQVRETLSLKSRAEYEARELGEDEAAQIVTRAARVVAYAQLAIPT